MVRLDRGAARRLALTPVALVAGQEAVVAVWAHREGGNAARAAVLAPLTVVLLYELAARMLGPRLGLVAAAVWLAGPWLLSALVDSRVDPFVRMRVTPAALGLSEWRGPAWALGLLAAALLAVAVPRVGGPVFGVLLALALADAWTGAHAFGRLWSQYEGLQEYFWTAPLGLWIPVAGAAGAARRSPWAGALVAVWAFAFLGVAGTSRSLGVADASIFAALVPAFPALALLVAALPALVPRLR